MTREQQISDAAQMSELTANRHDLDCFVAGAEWSDAHPGWHKFPDEKPPLKQRILIYTTTGRIVETMWHQPMLVSGKPHGEPTFEDNRYNVHNVIAWMENPNHLNLIDMEITDIIGEGKAFEPPFRRLKHLAIVDKNGKYLVDSTDYANRVVGTPIFTQLVAVTDHICDLLNREHCEEGGEG